ncbi:hypothetical protein [Methylobacterium oxalidis]|uniref:Uncharacterized protein n=1 Tax=Methylobacterium oxalidis TaxID=944322 RepID=A0A512J9I6_9HYPH|nr:hypothetical protein [Methylobacterium oxalidis]GEP06618.1 hypothetical protein MOX02_46560 [Methylobacterium oxalidis]GJE35401.1 hypothetical protein LDDCCGHA_5619 [Methylobacterium oxalidis]GLS66232.1 hypothetical protein GCM10007888_46140 [Methylobacterium oxalidis]
MTSKLKDRLSRLERARTGTSSAEVPGSVISVLARVLAFGSGDYQRGTSDCLSDAFARALGFVDRADLDRRLAEDDSIWEPRVTRAWAAMFAKHGLDGDAVTDEDKFALIARITRGSSWGPNDAMSIETDLLAVRQYFGLPPEEARAP